MQMMTYCKGGTHTMTFELVSLLIGRWAANACGHRATLQERMKAAHLGSHTGALESGAVGAPAGIVTYQPHEFQVFPGCLARHKRCGNMPLAVLSRKQRRIPSTSASTTAHVVHTPRHSNTLIAQLTKQYLFPT